MAPGSNGIQENTISPNDVVDGQQQSQERIENKTPRHPRWTRQETLVLIEGKNIAEERGRKGRRSSSVFGSDQLEPKWDFVSSHCRQNGVSRGPVQCRKRWSNLVSDFKKIKTWESQKEGEGESFWVMRSDLRRERKLPGFFDNEVFDVLDGKSFTTDAYRLALVTTNADEVIGDGLDDVEVEDVDEMVEDEEAEDGLFSESERVTPEEIARRRVKEISSNGKRKNIPSPVPISEVKYQPFHQAYPNQESKRQPGSHFWRGSAFQEGAKRRRQSSSDSQNFINMDEQLIKALERNTTLLNEQFESHKLNFQLNMEQQKDQHESLITALTKITDVIEKIANKL